MPLFLATPALLKHGSFYWKTSAGALDCETRRSLEALHTLLEGSGIVDTKANNPSIGCAGCGLNRRQFLAGCTACVAGTAGLGMLSPRRAEAKDAGKKVKVRLVYTFVPSDKPIWPNIGYDFEARMKELTGQLTAACPAIEFAPVVIHNVDEAKKMLAQDSGIDGYLVYMLGLWTGAPQVIGAAGKPTVFVDDLYGGSGEFLIATAAARRAGQKAVSVSSARLEDVAAVARCFGVLAKPGTSLDDFVAAADKVRRSRFPRQSDLPCTEDKVSAAEPGEVLKRLKESTILVIGRRNGPFSKSIENVFGTKVIAMGFEELQGQYEQADAAEAASWADRWMKAAEKVVEPKRDEIVRSGKMYLAKKALLKKYNAQAITINCLGGFYGNHIKAYPCLGFTQLNNDGLIGACEADQKSTISMLAMQYLSGRPGYISDPVIDTSKNQIIYAHCVASTKVFGPNGKSNPFRIRSHSEDRKGAAVQSLMPLGYEVTSVEFDPMKKQILMHQSKTMANVDEDKACRTKVAAEVKGDIDKLLNQWDQWGWHRVTVYGDLKEPVQALGHALGMQVVEEA